MWFLFTGICILIVVSYLGLIVFYYFGWKHVPLYVPTNKNSPGPATTISVIVPVRNEEKNIKACLDALAAQTLSKDRYEVIVVDDHSTDSTPQLLLSLKYPQMRLTVLNLEEQLRQKGMRGQAYKKWGIEWAVSRAVGDLIVTTDADCTSHVEWLATLLDFYEHTGAKCIAAPVKIIAGNQWLEIFQALDFAALQGITAASVHAKFHSMCNGANFAYEKKAFEEAGGYRGIDSIPSGDDMLLMHKIFLLHPDGPQFLLSPKAVVSTKAENTLSGFLNQRIRWASKASQYRDRRIFRALLLVYFANLVFPVLLIAGAWNRWYLLLFFLLLCLKIFVEYPFLRSVTAFFNQQGFMIYFPSFQPLHILYTLVAGWLGKFGSYQWKNRRIE